MWITQHSTPKSDISALHIARLVYATLASGTCRVYGAAWPLTCFRGWRRSQPEPRASGNLDGEDSMSTPAAVMKPTPEVHNLSGSRVLYDYALCAVRTNGVKVGQWTVCKCLPDDWHGNRDCPAHGGT
jgi:hypothetical protein